ncbi:unnamed protein product [Cyprideis torosa]|uniref:Uncharacterized protein n=1 Tax=Cyprideis torosa TaxID=163714 RepID=A0A7R8W3Q7_9CRUS|nr:unnamed protein product [Cyprideis torosa]CAG0883302.1 unnamed protein product [Cyprideis torosa]
MKRNTDQQNGALCRGSVNSIACNVDSPAKSSGTKTELRNSPLNSQSASKKVNGIRHLSSLNIHAKSPGRKSKKKKADDPGQSLGELIKKSTEPSERDPSKSALQITDVTALLLQGLRSKDQEILHRVFIETPPNVVEETVRKLPVPSLKPLLEELVSRIMKNSRVNQPCIHWLQCVCMSHTSSLSASEGLQDVLEPVSSFFKSQFSLYLRASQLHGRLTLLLNQATMSEERRVDSNPAQQTAQIQYVEESDEDDEQLGEGMLIPPSESEAEVWEEGMLQSSNEEESEEENEDEEEDEEVGLQIDEDEGMEVDEEENQEEDRGKRRKEESSSDSEDD